MASFGITTARDFLKKLLGERDDFEAPPSHCLSARHAINAVMTAYHLHEWVWGEFAKRRLDLHQKWGLLGSEKYKRGKCQEAFLDYLEQNCPALKNAQSVANGSKHFAQGLIKTGKDDGVFDPAIFNHAVFHVPHLWTDCNTEQRQNAKDFIRKLVDFWTEFFEQHAIP